MGDTADTQQTPERAAIDRALSHQGFMAESWEENEDGLAAKIAGTFTVIEDDEDAGLFLGDSGTLWAQAVGSAVHGSDRVMFWFVRDGEDFDTGNEPNDLSCLEHT